MTPSVPLRLTLIEGFALWRGSEELRIATSGQRLIALLALRDRPAGRLHVAGTLWPDYPTDRSLADLRTTLWRIRQSCDRVVAASSSFLWIDVETEVDVRKLAAFARRLNQPETAPLCLVLRRVIAGYVPASGVVLPWWVSAVSGMIAGCDRCAARGAVRGSA
jgi:DNA-binding SARP family transcriptional activator